MPATAPAPTVQGRLDRTKRRKTLIEAGWALLLEGGAKAVSIDAVVGRLGISRPIFYRHFEDRIDLLVALYDRYAAELVDRQRAVMDGWRGTDFEDLLRTTMRAYLAMVTEHGAVIRPMLDHLTDDPRMAAARERRRRGVVDLWKQAMGKSAPELLKASGRKLDQRLELIVDLAQGAAMEAGTAVLQGRCGVTEAADAYSVLLEGVLDRTLGWVHAPQGTPRQ